MQKARKDTRIVFLNTGIVTNFDLPLDFG